MIGSCFASLVVMLVTVIFEVPFNQQIERWKSKGVPAD